MQIDAQGSKPRSIGYFLTQLGQLFNYIVDRFLKILMPWQQSHDFYQAPIVG